MTPPRIRGLVQRFEKAIRMEFHDKANRPSRKRETAVARIDLLRAFAVVATPPASPDVEGLVKALELWLADYDEVAANPDFEPHPHVAERVTKSRAALSTWRQSQP